ncbi:uncharacterized protein LOC143823039 [Paroedura picta]|uniref:uncharacterized protein LOC143823039 n=1 Tax=Paroedura picta TaxID=143630 RepID=UPI00405600E0
MAWGPLLLLLFIYCAGALAQFTLTQPPSISAPLGETVRIPCARSSGSITSNYVSWYQQKDGGAPKMMIYQFSYRPTGIPDRFSGSTDASANSATLTISSVQAEDEADYYCLSYYGNQAHDDTTPWGSVTSQPWTQPATQSVSLGQTAKISCNTNSESYTISWYQQKPGHAPRYVHYPGGSRGQGIPDRFTASASGGTGYLTITSIQAEDERALGLTELSKFGIDSMAWPWFFLLVSSYCAGSLAQLSLIQPPSVSVPLGGPVILSCMHGSSGGTVGTVRWFQQTTGRNPRYLLSYNTESSKHQGSGVPDRFSASKESSGRICYLTITNVQAEDEGDYYCLVHTTGGGVHTVIQFNEDVKQKPTSFLPQVPPKRLLTLTMAWALYLLTVLLSCYSGVTSQPWTQPATQSVSLGGTAKLSCNTNSESYTISWHQQKPGHAPRYVHYPGGSRGQGIPDRFTASASGGTGYLTITGIQAEDEADYYCQKWFSSVSQFHSGKSK